MAIPVQEEKIPFKKEANVPYRYTCGSCGRTVEGEAIISATYLLHKKPVDDWDKPDKKALEITDEDVDYAERASASMLEREIGIWKRQTAAALPVVFSIKGKRSKGQKTAPPAIFWEELRRTED